MSVQKLIYENRKYNISQVEKNINNIIPSLVHIIYFDNMVIMPKCKCHIKLENVDIPSIIHTINTTGYIALVRNFYRSSIIKRGCIVRVLDYEIEEDDTEEYLKIYIEGIKRFLSYQDASIIGYPYEVIKPDFSLFKNDDTSIPIPINFSEINPIFIQFFLKFIADLNINNKIDFASLSLDKFLNSLIMIMPISDTERFYLSEIPSITKREKDLSLILDCTFNSLTSEYKYH